MRLKGASQNSTQEPKLQPLYFTRSYDSDFTDVYGPQQPDTLVINRGDGWKLCCKFPFILNRVWIWNPQYQLFLQKLGSIFYHPHSKGCLIHTNWVRSYDVQVDPSTGSQVVDLKGKGWWSPIKGNSWPDFLVVGWWETQTNLGHTTCHHPTRSVKIYMGEQISDVDFRRSSFTSVWHLTTWLSVDWSTLMTDD